MSSNGAAELFSEKVRKAMMEEPQQQKLKEMKQMELRDSGGKSILKNQPSFDSPDSSRSGSGTRRNNFECQSPQMSIEGCATPLIGQNMAKNGGGPMGSAGGGGPSKFNADMYAPPLTNPQKQPFSMAKAKMLNKNQSATDLSQYINPDMMMRRASLHQNAFDPGMKKVRQREAYKTAMCQAWLEGKACIFGDQCNFAHGEEELQPFPLNRPNPKYKTRICENYTTTGICPFGNRCFFIHPQPCAKMDDLLEYQEQLNQTARQLEGEAIYSHSIGHNSRAAAGAPLGGTPNMPRRMGLPTNKAKQFRKLESCGNFYTNYQLQQLQQVQLQQQRENEEKMAREMEEKDFYENFPPLSAVGKRGGGEVDSRRASKNTAVTGSMPLIHSNSSGNLVGNVNNMNYQKFVPMQNQEPNKMDKSLEERRLTFRKMQSQKSFSSNDVVWFPHSVVKPKPLLFGGMQMDPSLVGEQRDGEQGGSDSSGPHTPPGFYEQQKGFAGSSKWSSMSSTHPTHIWPGLDMAEQQKVPSFSLFGPTEQIGSGGDLLRLAGQMGAGQAGGGGKKSPISDFDGLFLGRRSSHTPYLDEGENTQTFLDVVFGGVGEKSGRNKSAEYLMDKSRSGGGGAGGAGNHQPGLEPVNSWQMAARSTGALDDPVARWHSQFGPPEGSQTAIGANFWGSGQIGGGHGHGQPMMAQSGGNSGGGMGGGGAGHGGSRFQPGFLQRQPSLQQQSLMAASFLNAAALTAAASSMAAAGASGEYDYGAGVGAGGGMLANSFPSSPHHPSAFRPIRHPQQQQPEQHQHFQSPLDPQSQYSSNSSVHASSLADELIRQSQSSLASSNLDVMRQIWASSSPELDKDYQQQQQQNKMPLWSELDGNEHQRRQQKVEIPSKLDFFSKRNDALERVLKQSKPEAISRNDTLTDTEKEEEEAGRDQHQQQREMNKLCESLNRLESAGVIGSPRKTAAMDGSDQYNYAPSTSSILDDYEPGVGAQTWAKRAMKKAFLRQKSHSSPAISRSGSISEAGNNSSFEK